MSPNLLKALVRSLTPWAISAIVGLGMRFHYHVNVATSVQIVGLVGALVTVGGHALEVKWPKFGVLLGWIGAPAYVPGVSKTQLHKQVAQLQAQLGAAPAYSATNVPTFPATTDLAPGFVPGAPVVVATSTPVAVPVTAVAPEVTPTPVEPATVAAPVA